MKEPGPASPDNALTCGHLLLFHACLPEYFCVIRLGKGKHLRLCEPDLSAEPRADAAADELKKIDQYQCVAGRSIPAGKSARTLEEVPTHQQGGLVLIQPDPVVHCSQEPAGAGEPCKNDGRRCREGNEGGRAGRDQPQWQAGPW